MQDNVIFSYTRAQAIADGVLVDVTDTAKACFRYPVALTRAVWDRYVKVPAACPWQDEDGRLWDILWMCRSNAHKADGPINLFTVHVNNGKGPKPVTLKAVCGPGDTAEPVITIMLPDED